MYHTIEVSIEPNSLHGGVEKIHVHVVGQVGRQVDMGCKF